MTVVQIKEIKKDDIKNSTDYFCLSIFYFFLHPFHRIETSKAFERQNDTK